MKPIAPTVVAGVRSNDLVACEEIFGPVLVLQSYATLNTALAEANASKYGLQSAIFTTTLETARVATRRLTPPSPGRGSTPAAPPR